MKRKCEAAVLAGIADRGNAQLAVTGDDRRSVRYAAWCALRHRASPAVFAYVADGRARRALPVNLDVDAVVLDQRRRMVAAGQETRPDREMKEKFLRGQNAF